MRISKNDEIIRSIDDWFRLAPPKGKEKQWVDGRSAKEIARAWFPQAGEPVVPPELLAALASCDDIGQVEFHEGWPERTVALDDYKGETRNADLLLTGVGSCGALIVSVEAKADEELGPTLDKQLAQATSPNSRIPDRLDNLCHALFARPYDAEPRLDHLRYQLLTGSVGALMAAAEHQCQTAVFLVYEFVGAATDDEKLRRNEADINTFIAVLSVGAYVELKSGQVLGPFRPRGGGVARGLGLYVGRAVREIRAGSA